jgi:Uncharacterized conserved protein
MSIEIKLEAFEGPLDLLLHLITREELDIYDIPIVSITSQYISAIGDIDQIDLDMATEFIVMASTLLEIKSKMLLPDKNEVEVFDYSYDDPRQELVKRLVEYKRYKDIANLLRESEGTLDEVIFREQDDLDKYVAHVPKETLNASMDSILLIEAVKRIVMKMNRFDENRQKYFKGIKRDLYTVDEKISLVRSRLNTDLYFEFNTLFGELITKEEVVVTFLALLELLKLKEVRIKQDDLFGDIVIQKRNYEDETHEIVEDTKNKEEFVE